MALLKRGDWLFDRASQRATLVLVDFDSESPDKEPHVLITFGPDGTLVPRDSLIDGWVQPIEEMPEFIAQAIAVFANALPPEKAKP